MKVSEKPSLQGSQTEKKFKCVYPLKRYHVLKFEFPAILLLKIIYEGLRQGKSLYEGLTLLPLYPLLMADNASCFGHESLLYYI